MLRLAQRADVPMKLFNLMIYVKCRGKVSTYFEGNQDPWCIKVIQNIAPKPAKWEEKLLRNKRILRNTEAGPKIGRRFEGKLCGGWLKVGQRINGTSQCFWVNWSQFVILVYAWHQGHSDLYTIYVHASERKKLKSVWNSKFFVDREIRSQKVSVSFFDAWWGR